jgi:Ca-activated chloride channel family protein
VSAQDPELIVTKTVDPNAIYANYPDLGCDPQETTVTLSVTGYGGPDSSVPIDSVFCIDSSGSMTTSDPTNLRRVAAKSFVDKMASPPDTAGVVSWDDNIDFTIGLTGDFNPLKGQIDNVDSIGNTNGNLALDTCIDMLDANPRVGESVEVIIFLTDGQFNTGGNDHNPILTTEALSKGYVVYTIGLGDAVDVAYFGVRLRSRSYSLYTEV